MMGSMGGQGLMMHHAMGSPMMDGNSHSYSSYQDSTVTRTKKAMDLMVRIATPCVGIRDRQVWVWTEVCHLVGHHKDDHHPEVS